MFRHAAKIDTHHSRMGFEMQSASERDEWQRTFPDPMPSTHELVYEWDAATATIWFRPQLKKGVTEAQAKAALERPPAGVPVQQGARSHADLNKLSVPDLETLAVEMGITVAPTWRKPAFIAAILEKQQAATPAK